MGATPTVGSEVTFTFDPAAYGPQVTALADDTFTIVWEDGRNIYGKQLDQNGSFTGGDFLAPLPLSDPMTRSVPRAFQQTNGRVVVTYSELAGPGDHDVIWHEVNADFSPDDNAYPTVASSADEALVGATATAGGGGAVVYEVAGTGADTHTVLQFMDSFGNPASNHIFVGDHAGETQSNASVIGLSNGNVAVAYDDFNNTTFVRGVRLHIYKPDETDVAGEVSLSGTDKNADFPDVATLKDGSLIVVWQESDGIVVRHVSEAGVPLAAAGLIPGSAGGFVPKVTALNDGGFMVAWTAGSGTESDGSPDEDIFLRRFTFAGSDPDPGTFGAQIHLVEPGDQGLFDMSLATLTDGRVVLGYSSETGNATNITTLDYRIFDPRNLVAHTGDYNNDGASDVLFSSAVNGVALWEMNGSAVTGGGVFQHLSAGWTIAGVGDFNADGKSDIVLSNGAAVALWDMNGPQVIGGGAVGQLGPGWSLGPTGDFDGDGKADILFQNTNGGLGMWEMNNTQVTGGGIFASLGAASGWSLAGTGDFDGNGKSDILLQNTDGRLALWEMNGTQVAGGGVIGTLGAASGWSVAGIGDFDGSGDSDILFENTNGALGMWEMNGTQVAGGGVFQSLGANSGWSVAAIGDYNSDGLSDILLHNSNGATSVWEMSGLQVKGGGAIGQIASPWTIQH